VNSTWGPAMFTTPADDALTLHYQPLVDRNDRVVGLEALMRWHHQKRGSISPEAFIPIFEQCGQIVGLSRWALFEACAEAARWPTRLDVAVNLSPVQFEEEDLPALVAAVLADTGLAPERLELDMTEAALISNPGLTRETLERLRALGVGIALDDFGESSAHPDFLRSFPFTKIKIDTSVVHGIETSAVARSVIHMAVVLAHSLDLVVAAEGVETAAQLAFLRAEGCDVVQGFLTGRPAAITTFADVTGARPGTVAVPLSSIDYRSLPRGIEPTVGVPHVRRDRLSVLS